MPKTFTSNADRGFLTQGCLRSFTFGVLSIFAFSLISLPEAAAVPEPFLIDRTLKGKISDESGAALPGVSIVVKGTQTGTVSDADGNYSLSVPDNATLLTFSFVGYISQEVAIGNQSAFNITLKTDLKALEEVVVVGYGTQKKTTITGALSTISTKDLEQSPTASITNGLAGRLPGLMANQFSGGEPGVDRSDILIRGMGTYGNRSPIVIIDGLERNMDYLAPQEIETFTILKDASATAPFGVRGANGVILITTKRGKVQDKATVNFKAAYGINQAVQFPEYLGSADYAMLYNEAIRNTNPDADPEDLSLFSQQAIDGFRRAKGDNSDGLGYNNDLFDYAFKPGGQQDYSLTISGGSNRARYFVLAGLFQQDGNYRHTDLSAFNTQAVFKRYNFRSNIDIDITDNFYARLDIAARITNRDAPGTTAARIVEMGNTQPPYLPIVVEPNTDSTNNAYEAINPLGMLYGDQIYRFNILGELSRTGFLTDRNTYLNGSFILGHKLDFITEGLKVEGLFSYDASNGFWIFRTLGTYFEGYREYPNYATFVPDGGSDVYKTPGHYEGRYITGNKFEIDQTIGNGFQQNNAESRMYMQLKLDYDRSFDNHHFTGMLLLNRSRRSLNNLVPFSYQGITGRITYDFGNRYMLEVDAAYNGSENFAKGKRYGFFPAASAGWVISNEPFFPKNSLVNNLKIRASHGLVGSDKIPNDLRFLYLQFYGAGGDYAFGTDNFNAGAGGGLTEGTLANPNLTWEKARKSNLGLDLKVFNSLGLTIDLFHEHRYDIITDLSGGAKVGYPAIVGKNAPFLNSGVVNNKGIDFEITYDGKIGRSFTYFIRPNFTFARNRIEFMNEVPYPSEFRRNTGKRIDENFVYLFNKFVATQEEADALNQLNDGAGFQPWGLLRPGDVVYKDLNGDGRIDDLGDRTNYGNPRVPEFMFGIPIGGRWKDFDFSALFQGALNSSLSLSGAAVWDFPIYNQDKIGKVKPMHLNRWTPETAATATYPALRYGDYTNNKNSSSSLFLYNSKYMRLKTIEIGYNLPAKLLQKAKIQQLRVYAQGMNLFTWDGLSEVNMDPETRNGSGDWYPIQKIVNFGIDLTF